MPALQIIILALIQGITEFLPISSSGHLILIPHLTGWSDQGAIIDVAVHMGTLAAVMLYFRRDTIGLAAALIGNTGIKPARVYAEKTGHDRLFWVLIVATLPIIIAGFIIKMLNIDEGLRSPMLIATTSIVFGFILYIVDIKFARTKGLDDMKIRPALLVGLAQILALLPGTSRSGITITAARIMGFNRLDGARFSMLLSIPTILGAGILTATKVPATVSIDVWVQAGTAMLLACLAALAAIHFFMKWLEHASMAIFAVYRIGLGILLFALIVTGTI